MPRYPFRVAGRLLQFLWFCVTALGDFFLTVRPAERRLARRDYRLRADWSHRHARRLSRILQLKIEVFGSVPAAQLLCSNHLSYLDIVTLVAAAPMVFVSKAEVRNWPIVGWLTQCAGSIYLRRERKGDLLEVARQLAPVIAAEVPVVIFLEGTSSGGDTVLPFRPSLLEPAVAQGWTVAPVALDYAVSEGTVADDVAYWRDMTFASHFLNLLSKTRLGGRVAFGPARKPATERKQLALELHGEVAALRRNPCPSAHPMNTHA